MSGHPSLALELPNGDVALNDDFRHRVVVMDRQSTQTQLSVSSPDGSGIWPSRSKLPFAS
jgi:hypothetical protein